MTEAEQMIISKASMLLNIYQVSFIAKRAKLVITQGTVTKIEQLNRKPVAVWVKQSYGMYFLDADGMDAFPITGDTGFSEINLKTLNTDHGQIHYVQCIMKTTKAPLNLYGPDDIMALWYDALRYVVLGADPETHVSLNYRELLIHGLRYPQAVLEKTPKVPPPPPDTDWD